MSSQSLSTQEKLKLESWGLPKYILQKYQKKGLHSMFPWQLECLTSADVLQGGNLVYSAPTSAGKTLVAEILTFQTVLERKKKVIIILPFVSVVREKMLYFQDLLAGSGVRVEGFMGSYNPPGGFRAVHVAICTIEKANSLINRLLEENNFDNIGCVVVDELHLLGDPHRGYLLELLLTKLRYICKKGLCSPIQIVGMSATLPNLDVLAAWLDATLYKTDFRPIPLVEYLKVNRNIYKLPFLSSGTAFEPEFPVENDVGDVIYLCVDTIIKGYSVLVFCPSRSWCESLALQIAGEIKRLGSASDGLATELRKQLKSDAISDTLQQLKNSPVGLETVLGKCISFGAAFHHAGLTLDERDIIEESFRKNIVRVLVATSTLSSGVNLPARRVIIRSPLFNGKVMDVLTYKQMVGRAGRMGRDTAGESFLLCTDDNKSQAEQLVKAELPVVESCLGRTDLSNSLKRAVLEVIASGLISSLTEIERYVNCTLLAAYEDPDKINQAVKMCMKYLLTKGFIDIRNEVEISASPLAEACLSASMTPDQGLALLAELDRARKNFVLDSDLHAVYQVTPFSVSNQWSLDWMRAFSIWETLSNNVQKVGYMVGVEDRFLIKAMRGTMNFHCSTQVHQVAVHKRFFTALALQDLINEVPLNAVADKYGCNKGLLQSLQQSASTFSGMVTNFCRKLSWGALEVVVSQLGQRIQFGAHRDLLDLLRLECLSSAMARGLYNKDLTSVPELAQSTIKEVAAAIRKTLPYTSASNEENIEKRDVYLPGRPGLTVLGAAEVILNEARSYLMRELGVERVEWSAARTSTDIYELSTIGPESKNQTSLNLSVSSADFDNLNQSQGTRIVVDKCNESTNSQIEDQCEVNSEVHPASFELVDTELTEIVTSCGNNVERGTISGRADEEHCEAKTGATEDEEEADETNSKFCSLLEISNPCIPRISRRSSNSSLASENEEVANDNIVPNSQSENCILNAVNTRFKLNLTQKYVHGNFKNGMNKETDENADDLTDYNNLQISNFSKVFGDTFSGDSPRNGAKFDTMKYKKEINSSTPYQSRDNWPIVKSNEENFQNGCVASALKKLGSLSDTPETKSNGELNGAKPSPAVSELSEVDIFADSRSTEARRLSSPSVCEINSTLLVDLDSNWGGDSLLLASQVMDNVNETLLVEVSTKRKLENDEEKPSKRLCRSGVARSCEESTKQSAAACFNGSFTLNSQIIDQNSVPVALIPAEEKNIEAVDSPVIDSKSSQSFKFENKTFVDRKNSLTDSFLAEAFLDSFKCSAGKLSGQCGTPEMFESPIAVNQQAERPQALPKPVLTVETAHLPSHDSSTKLPPVSSPVNSVIPSASPSKYPAVEVSFVKCQNKSPLLGKSKFRRGRHELSISRSTCKRSLISEDEDFKPHNSDVKVESNKLIETKLVGSATKSGKTFRKVKSETWGRHVDKEEEIMCSEPKDTLQLEAPEENDFKASPALSSVLNVTDVCRNIGDNSIVTKLSSVMRCRKEVVFTLETTKCSSEENRIGMKVIRSKTDKKKPDFHYGTVAITGIYFHFGDETYYCCLRSSGCVCLQFVHSVFKRKDATIIGYDLSWQIKILYQAAGIVVNCKLWDVSVAEWILNPQEEKSELKRLANDLLSSDEISVANFQKSPCTAELVFVFALKPKLLSQLLEHSLLDAFTDVEMPLRRLLSYMEISGMPFDQTLATQLWNRVRETMSQLEEQIHSKSRRHFSLSSNKELKKVKESLNIKAEDLGHPLLANVQNWRKLNSLKTRNLSQLLMTPLAEGRCRSQTSTFTVTGRIVMHTPNLQHVPRDFTVGAELFSLRSAFVAKPGHLILSADYCQLELRILAHFSKDPELLSSFENEVDVFVSIAAKWNKITAEQVTEDVRHQTKQIIYGIIYGMGDRALSNALGVDPPEAAMLAAKFRRSYPGVQRFIHNCIEDCQKKGYISTLTGRVRKLKDINSSNKSLKAQAERQAVNSTIQGTAADIAKLAAVRIESKLSALIPERGPTITPLSASHLVLHLHDELVYEVSKEHVELVKDVVKMEMIGAARLQVPLPVVLKCGPSWGQLTKI